MTFRRGRLEGVPRSGDLAATSRPRGCTRPHRGEHDAPGSNASSSRSWFPGRTREVQSRRLGPAPGPRPPAARTHPRRRPGAPNPPGAARAGIAHLHRKRVRRPAGSESRSCAGSGRSVLDPSRPGGSAPGAAEGGARRAAAEPGGRRRWKRTRGARLSGDPPSSWPLCRSRPRSLPGRWGVGGAGWKQLPARGRRGGEGLGAAAGEQWPGGRGAPAPALGARRAAALPFGRPRPGPRRPAR